MAITFQELINVHQFFGAHIEQEPKAESRGSAIAEAYQRDQNEKYSLFELVSVYLKARSRRDEIGMLIEIQAIDALGYEHLASVLMQQYTEYFIPEIF